MLIITSVSVVISESGSISTVSDNKNLDYKTYSEATIIIFGSCDSASILGFSWRFGLYIPLSRKTFYINSNGNNNSLNVIVLKSNQGVGFFYQYDTMYITLVRARGIFFYGGKSLLTTSNVIFTICNARTATISN
jgi:hypothetical protein